jgi:hypothetical protein
MGAANKMREHVIRQHGMDAAGARQLIVSVWPKPSGGKKRKKAAGSLVNHGISAGHNSQDLACASSSSTHKEKKDIENVFADSLHSGMTIQSSSPDLQGEIKGEPNGSRVDGNPEMAAVSVGLLRCRHPDCSYTVSHVKEILKHWNRVHSRQGLQLEGGPAFQEVSSGQTRRLFDIYRCVVMCGVCKMIRKG